MAILQTRTLATLNSPLLFRYNVLNSTRTTTFLLRSAAYATARRKIHPSKLAKNKGTKAKGSRIPKLDLDPLDELFRLSKTKTPSRGKHGSKQSNDKRSQHLPTEKKRLEFGWANVENKANLPKRRELENFPSKPFVDPKKTVETVLRDWEDGDTDVKMEEMSDHFRCNVSVKFANGDELVAPGDGRNPQQAEQAAYLHMLAKMNEHGIFKRLYVPEKLSSDVVADEKKGLIDVYNYAALHGCIPDVSFRIIGRNLQLVVIKMAEHGIMARGICRGSSRKAEVGAAIDFKKQAEKYHVDKGLTSLVVKESTALSTATAKQFFQFCKDTRAEESQIEVELNVSAMANRDIWEGTAILKGAPLEQKVYCGSRAEAEDLTYLLGAVLACKEKPELLDKFTKALRAGNGAYLSKMRPIDALINGESLEEMKMMNAFFRRNGRPQIEDSEQHGSEGAEEAGRTTRRRRQLPASKLDEKSAELEEKLRQYQSRADLAKLRQTRSELPMSQYAPQVLELVQNNIFCVIIGATGSGKTTQVPQILLDQAIRDGQGSSCNVVCTQPRRIAATSVARRVADERTEQLQDTVGYHVRHDAKLPQPGGSINFCTTGILLQQLQHDPDDVYDNVSHLVIDEVHERDLFIDFLLITLKKTMAERAAQGKKLPHVVLMSATIDAESFASYFRDCLPDAKAPDCPTLRVPGRTFPVTERYLEHILPELHAHERQHPDALKLLQLDKDTREYLKLETSGLSSDGQVQEAEESIIDWKKRKSDGEGGLADNQDDGLVPVGLAATTIAHIAKTTDDGAVLVFLPGLEEITKLDKMLREQGVLDVDFNDEARFRIFMLHSSIQQSQKTVFDPVPDGCRKIILSTNIAETSVTIPDIQFVVDLGKSREKRYDQVRRITQLKCTWVSQSNAKQRAGRAGRVQNGNYYALFTRARRESMRAIGLPELLRSDLQEVCLDIKTQAFKMPVRDFLAEALEPPSALAVDTALKNLVALDCLTDAEELTPLGRLLASLPVHPGLGKMIVLGIIFKCLDPIIVLGAAAHERSLFVNPPERKREAEAARRRLANGSNSDHLAVLKAFDLCRQVDDRALFRVTDEFFIHRGAFNSIRATATEIEGILCQAGLIPRNSDFGTRLGTTQYGGPALNQNSGSEEIVKALLLAGLHPNVACATDRLKYRTGSEKFTFIHPSSINARGGDSLVTFTTLALANDGNRMNLRDTTAITPLMAALFGGKMERQGPIITMDQWLPFFVKAVKADPNVKIYSAATDVDFFRSSLDAMLAKAFRDLSKRESLMDDSVRDTLAAGLVNILRRESGEEVDNFDAFAAHRKKEYSARRTRLDDLPVGSRADRGFRPRSSGFSLSGGSLSGGFPRDSGEYRSSGGGFSRDARQRSSSLDFAYSHEARPPISDFRDSRESRSSSFSDDAREYRPRSSGFSRDARESQFSGPSRDTREYRPRSSGFSRDARDSEFSRPSRDTREYRPRSSGFSRDARESEFSRPSRDARESRPSGFSPDARESQFSRPSRDTREYRPRSSGFSPDAREYGSNVNDSERHQLRGRLRDRLQNRSGSVDSLTDNMGQQPSRDSRETQSRSNAPAPSPKRWSIENAELLSARRERQRASSLYGEASG